MVLLGDCGSVATAILWDSCVIAEGTLWDSRGNAWDFCWISSTSIFQFASPHVNISSPIDVRVDDWFRCCTAVDNWSLECGASHSDAKTGFYAMQASDVHTAIHENSKYLALAAEMVCPLRCRSWSCSLSFGQKGSKCAVPNMDTFHPTLWHWWRFIFSKSMSVLCVPELPSSPGPFHSDGRTSDSLFPKRIIGKLHNRVIFYLFMRN